MSELTVAQVVQVAARAGFKGEALVTAVAVSRAENSKGETTKLGDIALEDEKWGPSVGLWQIRSLRNPERYHGADRLRDQALLTSPDYNAKAAYEISRGGQEWKWWTTYTTGAFRKYLGEVRAVISGLPDNPALALGTAAAVGEPLRARDVAPYLTPDETTDIVIGGGGRGTLSTRLITGTVELSVTQASQLTLVLDDPDCDLLTQFPLYFGAGLRLQGQVWSITGVTLAPGPQGRPTVQITAQPVAVAALRRVVPAAASTTTPTRYVEALAKAAGLRFVGQPTATLPSIAPQDVTLSPSVDAAGNVISSSTPATMADVAAAVRAGGYSVQQAVTAAMPHQVDVRQAPDARVGMPASRKESAWDVAQRLAQESGAVCFVDGTTMRFASPEQLVKLGESVVALWGADQEVQTSPDPDGPLPLVEYPTIRATLPNGVGGLDVFSLKKAALQATLTLGPDARARVRPGQRLVFLNLGAGLTTAAEAPLMVTRVSWSIESTANVQVEASTVALVGQSGAFDQSKVTYPKLPEGSKTYSSLDFVTLCLAQAGDRYLLGATPNANDPDPDIFDCSSLVQWAAHQVGVDLPRTSTQQWAFCRDKGQAIDVASAAKTRGALLFRIGVGTYNHVAVSLGDGSHTIEAMGHAYGVRQGGISGRRWTSAALIPGMRY